MANNYTEAYPCSFVYGQRLEVDRYACNPNFMTVSNEPRGRYWQRLKLPVGQSRQSLQSLTGGRQLASLRWQTMHRRLTPWSSDEERAYHDDRYSSLVRCLVNLDPEKFPVVGGPNTTRRSLRLNVSIRPAASDISFTREGSLSFRIPNLHEDHPAYNKKFLISIVQQSHVQRPDGTWCWGADTSIRSISIEQECVMLDKATRVEVQVMQLAYIPEVEEDSSDTDMVDETEPADDLPDVPVELLHSMYVVITGVFTNGCVCTGLTDCAFCKGSVPAYTRLWTEFIDSVDAMDSQQGTRAVPTYAEPVVIDTSLQRHNCLTAQGADLIRALVDDSNHLTQVQGYPPLYPYKSQGKSGSIAIRLWVLGDSLPVYNLHRLYDNITDIEQADFTRRDFLQQYESRDRYASQARQLRRELKSTGCSAVEKLKEDFGFAAQQLLMNDIEYRLDKALAYSFLSELPSADLKEETQNIHEAIERAYMALPSPEQLMSGVNDQVLEDLFRAYLSLETFAGRLESSLWSKGLQSLMHWLPGFDAEQIPLDHMYDHRNYSRSFGLLFDRMETVFLSLPEPSGSNGCDVRTFCRFHKLIDESMEVTQAELALMLNIDPRANYFREGDNPGDWRTFDCAAGLDRLKRWVVCFDMLVLFEKIMTDDQKFDTNHPAATDDEIALEEDLVKRVMCLYRTTSIDLIKVYQRIRNIGRTCGEYYSQKEHVRKSHGLWSLPHTTSDLSYIVDTLRRDESGTKKNRQFGKRILQLFSDETRHFQGEWELRLLQQFLDKAKIDEETILPLRLTEKLFLAVPRPGMLGSWTLTGNADESEPWVQKLHDLRDPPHDGTGDSQAAIGHPDDSRTSPPISDVYYDLEVQRRHGRDGFPNAQPRATDPHTDAAGDSRWTVDDEE